MLQNIPLLDANIITHNASINVIKNLSNTVIQSINRRLI